MYRDESINQYNINAIIFHIIIDDDWEIPFESISDLQWLGSGAQGAVFVGKFNTELVAVKKVKEFSDTNIHHLKKLNHHNIIQFRGVCTQAPVFCIGELYYYSSLPNKRPGTII